MFKKIIYIIVLTFFVTSCGDTGSSIKRGLTGAKSKGGDEFLVKKKDPLILPPDFETLPSPDERAIAEEEYSVFEKTLEASIEDEKSTSTPGSAEESILKKIQSQ